MDVNSHEPVPELPRPEHISPRVDDVELVKAPEEQAEVVMPREALVKANDAISQAMAVPVLPAVDDSKGQTATIPVNNDNPAYADDVDVIEKEWVQKAKQIVANTKDDPRAQSAQMNVFKHDYMKKRYGKEIKLPEEQKGS